jgi:CubicO group peptidase (beta-lactamase class C family)
VVAGLLVIAGAGSIAGGSERWPDATPESQGVDSGALADLLDHVRAKALPLHSLLVIRHDAVVLNASVYPYEEGRPHDVASVTKSVVSILIGIALDKGLLASLEQPVVTLLPAEAPRQPDSRLAHLTVADLLTMRSGFDCDATAGEAVLAGMRRSRDWAAYTLALPFAAEPGQRFAYCSSNNHLLSSVLSARSGLNARAFAQKYLFSPLGIEDVVWPADPDGRTHGWGDLRLRPLDMAKLGYLYLHEGQWNGRQIVSKQWVRESTAPHVFLREGVAYAYSWWINTRFQPNIVEAQGRGGQLISVLPTHDAVLAVTGGGLDTDEIAPYLLEAMRAERPLPPNPAGAARLRAALAAAGRAPEPTRPASLPPRAGMVSGRSYVLDANPLGWRSLSLDFSGPAEARVTLGTADLIWRGTVGLDGRYRLASAPDGASRWAARGGWQSDDEFLLDLNTVTGINHFLIRIAFDEREARLTVDEVTGELKALTIVGRPLASARVRRVSSGEAHHAAVRLRLRSFERGRLGEQAIEGLTEHLRDAAREAVQRFGLDAVKLRGTCAEPRERSRALLERSTQSRHHRDASRVQEPVTVDCRAIRVEIGDGTRVFSRHETCVRQVRLEIVFAPETMGRRPGDLPGPALLQPFDD